MEDINQQSKDSETIVVAGSGAAGLAMAITAARLGSRVFLVERNPSIGGTVTQSLLHTLGGFYSFSGELINPGLPKELAGRLFQASSLTCTRKIGRTCVLVVAPEIYEKVVETWLKEEPNIHLLRGAQITQISTQGGLVTSLEINHEQRTHSMVPTGLVDATGNGSLVRLVDPDLIDNQHIRIAAGLIFQIRGVKGQKNGIKFPRNVQWLQSIRQAVEKGQLPSECAFAWIDTGVNHDEAYIKLALPLKAGTVEDTDRQDLMRKGIDLRDTLVAFLRSLDDFSDIQIVRTGSPGIRYAGSVKGEYYLTEEDIRSGRHFEDCACRGCWPIEYWDSEKGISVEYLPNDQSYEIPLGALRVSGFRNFWAPGKCFSAEPRVQASARVVGCCWAMGEAVGRAMALSKS